MKTKTLAILVILCATFAYIGLKKEDSKKGKSIIEDTTPLSAIDLNSITQIDLKKGKQNISLKKNNEEWRATSSEGLDFPINFQKLREFLITLRDLKLESRITRSNAHDEKFGLSESTSPTLVTLLAGDKLIGSLSLGMNKEGKAAAPNPAMPFNMGAPPAGQYLHLNEDQAVYLTPKPLPANMQASNWMIESIAQAKLDEMSNIEFHYPHKSFKLEKSVQKIEKSTDGSKPAEEVITWNASGDLPTTQLDSSKVNDLLDDLKEVKVNEPVAAKLKSSFTDNGYGVKVSRGENNIYELKAHQIGTDWYIYNLAKEEEIYKISSFRLEDIFSKNSDLFKLSGLKVADNVNQITLKDNGQMTQLTLKGSEWSISGKAPTPKIKKDKVEALIKLTNSLGALDYHVTKLPKALSKTTEIKTENKTISIVDHGTVPMKSGKVIKISGQKTAYSIKEADYNSIFPKVSEVLDFKSPSENVAALKALAYKDFTLTKSEAGWQFSNADPVNEAMVDALWTSYEAVFESHYQPNGTIETVKNTLKVTHSDDSIETLSIGPAAKGIVSIKSSRFGGTFKVNLDLTRSLFNGRMAFAKAVDKSDSKAN